MKPEVEPCNRATGWKTTAWFYFIMTAFVVFMFGFTMGRGEAKLEKALDDVERSIQDMEDRCRPN